METDTLTPLDKTEEVHLLRKILEEQTTQFNEALASRDVIGQAKGILMHRNRVSADDAFDILKRASQKKHMKLHTVAEEVVLALGARR